MDRPDRILQQAYELFLGGTWDNTQKAHALAEAVVQQSPHDWRGWLLLGKTANYLRQWVTAEKAFNRTLALCPHGEVAGVTDAWLGLTILREVHGNLAEAVEFARRAKQLMPGEAAPWLKYADMLRNAGFFADAEQAYARALHLRPSWKEVLHNRGFLRFRQQRWRDAWLDYNKRWETAEFVNTATTMPQTRHPRWGGAPLGTRRLYLWPEQGYGDALWAMRYIPLLLQRHPDAVVTLRTHNLLYRHTWINLRHLPNLTIQAQRTVSPDVDDPPPEHDVHMPIMNLPLALELWAPQPELRQVAETGDVVAWPADCKNVGIVWAGRPGYIYDACRSTRFADWAPVLDVPGVRFVSLQLGDPAEDARAAFESVRVYDVRADIQDFADTANLMAGLDLVIGVDTAAMHLAASLGVPTWWLLGPQADWRWGPPGDTTPWYTAARLWRAGTTPWPDVLQQVAHGLTAWVQQPPMEVTRFGLSATTTGTLS